MKFIYAELNVKNMRQGQCHLAKSISNMIGNQLFLSDNLLIKQIDVFGQIDISHDKTSPLGTLII